MFGNSYTMEVEWANTPFLADGLEHFLFVHILGSGSTPSSGEPDTAESRDPVVTSHGPSTERP